MSDQPSAKRARYEGPTDSAAAEIRSKRSNFLSSLSRPISPPVTAKETSRPIYAENTPTDPGAFASGRSSSLHREHETKVEPNNNSLKVANPKTTTLPSPFQLTRVRGLPTEDNVDTINLHDILGDPLIKEAWIFNFCFDVGWTMRHFDEDVRSLVKVKIIHGSWKQEDGNRQGIEDDMKIWKNVEDIKAYLPDRFGTHHSKMIILFKHDCTAQVIIHTANMLEKDWHHMTQAVWRSPALPMIKDASMNREDSSPIGSGPRFKADLLRYIKVYGSKLKSLSNELIKHDFSKVRAALIASVPSYAKVAHPLDSVWGHLSLRGILRDLNASQKYSCPPNPNTSHLIAQVSSIATLPQTYLEDTLYKAASSATTSIIYPTQSDLRSALTGYATGGSIHTRISTLANQKQVSSLRPHLHRWGAQPTDSHSRAGRHTIPPHIKTYISFASKPTADQPTPDINWVLLTSANLSQQAWGTIPKTPKNASRSAEAVVHIQSFEIGVLVWPDLFRDDAEHDPEDLDRKGQNTVVRMVPVFGKDLPEELSTLQAQNQRQILVGLRMPYDLPLTPYGVDEMPWSPSESYAEPDRLGRTWP